MRILVVGIGNVLCSDDGFGSEVAARLLARPDHLPEGVEVLDVGIRGLHLAHRLLDGYDVLLVVDTTHRDGPPGALYLLEHHLQDAARAELDPHGMSPDAVLGLLDGLARDTGAGGGAGDVVGRVLVLGCEPADLEPGLGLSAPVAAAVDEAVAAVGRVVDRLLAGQDFETRDEEVAR
ncbi:hydrogenase maturation protease [Actinomycetospora sp. TBRC 11914]|uniref:hydrogenase maturation protease n=1 Tax=Actinomycetospora sp. TBRC 11914 TaxID=2729387 RepID=UPI00145CEBB6|nr:hydrogenase maturation protease [Actinomycetospora sp. TBRC 11914]NMO91320.1 hydrogenase maturation protease [Actinomycetospora sp. TBRC 11914]